MRKTIMDYYLENLHKGEGNIRVGNLKEGEKEHSNMTDMQYDKYVKELEERYDSGELTYEQFNRYMRELREEYNEGY